MWSQYNNFLNLLEHLKSILFKFNVCFTFPIQDFYLLVLYNTYSVIEL